LNVQHHKRKREKRGEREGKDLKKGEREERKRELVCSMKHLTRHSSVKAALQRKQPGLGRLEHCLQRPKINARTGEEGSGGPSDDEGDRYIFMTSKGSTRDTGGSSFSSL
jgi:hypothetical protein